MKSLGAPRKVTGKSYKKVTKVRKVIKCIIDCKIDQLAFEDLLESSESP